MRVQKRDMVIFNYIYKFGALTAEQISSRFSMHIKVCQRRLRKLLKQGYLNFISLLSNSCGRSPYLFYLGERGASLLNVDVSKPRISSQLSHQQKNTDLIISIILSFRGTNIQCDVLPEHLIRTSQEEKTTIPDGAVCLRREGKNALFLVENCTGSEIISSQYNYDISTKLVKYTGMFAEDAIDYYRQYFNSQFSRFRLLFIANSPQRLSSISKIVLQHDSYGFSGCLR